jgi:hypothetical protein
MQKKPPRRFVFRQLIAWNKSKAGTSAILPQAQSAFDDCLSRLVSFRRFSANSEKQHEFKDEPATCERNPLA